MCPNLFLCEWRWWLYVTFDSLLPHRVSSVHENDRLSSVAVELHFKSLSRHSSPTEDREGLRYLTLCKVSFLLNIFCKFSLVFPEPSYPKADPSSTARRSWELRNFISQSKGKIKKINYDEFMSWKRIDESTSMQNSLKYISIFFIPSDKVLYTVLSNKYVPTVHTLLFWVSIFYARNVYFYVARMH